MQISLLTVVTFMNVLVSAESTFMRGGSTNSDKDTNSNHRSLALSECSDSGEVLYKDKTCDWISAINNKKKVKTICNKKTKLGRIYDLCPSTCSGVDLGPCTTSKLGETITDEDEDNDIPANDLSVTFEDMKAEKEALEVELAGLRDTISKMDTIIEEKDAAVMTSKQATSDCVAVNAEKVAVLEERIGELEVAEKLFLQEQESLDSLRAEKVAVTAEKEDLKAQVTAVNKENVLLVEAEYTANEIIQDLVATKVAVIEEKDTLEAQVTAVNKKNDDLKARVDELMEAELRSKLEFRTDQPSECGTCNGCLKPGDCNNDDYNQTSCEQIDLVWCGTPSTTTSTASDCNAVTEEKDALEAQVTAVNKEKDNLMARVNELVDTERLFIQEQESLDATTQRFIDSLRAEKDDIIAEKYELKETIESLREEKNAAEEQLSSFVEASSNCTAVTAENDDFKAQVTTIIAEKVVLEDRVTAVNKEKDDLMARVDELVEAERLFIEKQISLDTNTMMVIKALGVEKDAITAEKDAEIDALKAILASTTSPTSSPTTSPTTSPTKSPTYAPTKPPTNAPTTKPPTKSPTTKPPTKSPTTLTCPGGMYVYNGECSPCNQGTSGTNGLTCDPCSAGTYNPNPAQTECTPCPVDTFSDKVGSITIRFCKPCPQGKTITTTGATTEDQCTNCPVNTYGLPVDPNIWGSAGCRSCSDLDIVRNSYGTTTCGKTGAKSYLGCAHDTPADQNPDCYLKSNGKYMSSMGSRVCGTNQYCSPNDGDERPKASPPDDNYHSE